MGHHDVGRGMAGAAKVYWLAMGDREPTQEQALAALDAAGEDYHGADAEFDDELNEWTPLSRLVAIAFAATPEEISDLKGETPDDDQRGMIWYEGAYSRFREHFRFC